MEDPWIMIPLKHVSFLHAILKTQVWFNWSCKLVCLHTSSHKHSSCENHQHCIQGLQTQHTDFMCNQPTFYPRLTNAICTKWTTWINRYGHGRNTRQCKCTSCLLHSGPFKLFQSTQHKSHQEKSGQLIFWDIFTFVWCDILHDAQLIVYTSLWMHLTTQCKNNAEWSCAIPYSRSSFARLANQRTLKSIFPDVIGFIKLDSNSRCEGGWPAKLWYHLIW